MKLLHFSTLETAKRIVKVLPWWAILLAWAILIFLILTTSTRSQPIQHWAAAWQKPSSGNSDIPSTIGLSISNRWMAAHWPTNQTGISDWPDETNSFHWVKTASASNATNSNFGVWLDGTHCFDGTNFLSDGALVQFFIFTWKETAVDRNDSLYQDTTKGQGFGAADTTALSPNRFQYGFLNPLAFVSGVKSNATWNIIWTGSTWKTLYTNGVNTTQTNSTVGNAGGTMRIGANTLNNNGFNGMLAEHITFKDTSITTSQISNLNYYGTHYPYLNN